MKVSPMAVLLTVLQYHIIHLTSCEPDFLRKQPEVTTGQEATDPIARKTFEPTYAWDATADPGVSYRSEYLMKTLLLVSPSRLKTKGNEGRGDDKGEEEEEEEKKGKELMESKQASRGEKQQAAALHSSSPNLDGSLTRALFIDLLEVVAGYLHRTELVLVANRSTLETCRRAAWSLYRRNYKTTCTSYDQLSGYYSSLILLAGHEDGGQDISGDLTGISSRIDVGEIQVSDVVVLMPSSVTRLKQPPSWLNYCAVQLKEKVVEFREVFTYGPNTTKPAEELVGLWSPGGRRKKLPHRSEILAPKDFRQNVVRVAIIQSEPHVIIQEVNGTLQVSGFLAELMIVLAQQLNFSLEWIQSPDNEHGIQLDNGTWTGLVGLLHRKEADVAVSPLSLTIPRLSVMDFSPAVDHDAVRLVIKNHLEHDPMDWGTYIEGFHWSVWVSLVALWLAMSIGIAKVAEPDNEVTVYNYLFHFIGALAQQGCAAVPSYFRGRVIVFFFWVGSVLLYAAYTACLTSQLAVVPDHQPFHTLSEAITSAGYYLSTRKGTSYVSEMKAARHISLNIFQTSRDEGLRKAYEQLMADPSLLVDSTKEGIQLLHSRERKVVFMLDVNSIGYELQGSCSYKWVGAEYFPEYVYIGYRKNLSYANILSNYISKAADYGITYKLRGRWQYNQRHCDNGGAFRRLTFSKTILAFTILTVGVCLGWSILILERFLKYRHSKRLLYIFTSKDAWVKVKKRRRSTLYKQVSELHFINK